MANDFTGLKVSAELAEKALTRIDRQVDKATRTALKKSQTVAKSAVRSGMRGRPRWDRRGPGRSGPAVKLMLNPPHVVKSGGPGSLTGHLRRAVGGVKRPKQIEPGVYSGGVGVGGPESGTRLYRWKVEANFPFMKPGVAKATPKFAAIYEAEWRRATE